MSHKRSKRKINIPGLLALLLLIGAAAAVILLRLPKYAGQRAAPIVSPATPSQTTAPAPVSTASGGAVTPSPVVTAEPEPEYFVVSMVGDCTLSASKDKRGWGIGFQMTVGDDYTYPFANTRQFLNGDYLTIANLECSLSDKGYSSIEQFSFLGKAAYADILADGSVEFVTLANNHTMDFGQKAYDDTAAALDAVGVAYAGEDECYIYQAEGGLKIGLYCLYNGLTGNALSNISAASREKLVAESKQLLDAAVKKLAEQGAEYTIACLHMGTEGNYETTDVQVELCRYAIDAGFGSVYCTHAHRLQPAELYKDGIIFYGLGNWIFGGHTNPGNGKDPASYDTGIGQITLCRRGDEVTLDGFGFIPCSISSKLDPENGVPGVNTVNNYQPTPYVEGGKAWTRAMSIISGTYEGANYTVGNYWDILSAMGG